MKVGDMVKHTPWKDEYVRWINKHSDFIQGLVVDVRETSKEIHYLVTTHSGKPAWYRETELEVINESR